MSQDRASTRRQFLKRTAAAAGLVAFPSVVPSSALGNAGGITPSERITMASIGLGIQGTGLLQAFLGQKDAHVVAVCDVDAKRLAEARRLAAG